MKVGDEFLLTQHPGEEWFFTSAGSIEFTAVADGYYPVYCKVISRQTAGIYTIAVHPGGTRYNEFAMYGTLRASEKFDPITL